MTHLLKQVILSAAFFLLFDGIYIYSTAGYFDKQINMVQGSTIRVNLLGTFITYIFLLAGLNYFILSPNKSWKEAAILGLFVYGVYEYTNLSILKSWKWETTVMDTLWGGVLFGATTFLTQDVLRRVSMFTYLKN
jgi:uncharacterized membrane protein